MKSFVAAAGVAAAKQRGGGGTLTNRRRKMFGRKRSAKGGGQRRGKTKNTKAKKVVKRLLEKPGPDRMADVAKLAAVENLQPFMVRKNRLLTLFHEGGERGGREMQLGY